MLSIGEFSKICKVSAKTLRYYAEIGLLLPEEINPENGYRYYAVGQLEKMLFINRLKSYHFSLDEIKAILASDELQEETLYLELTRKRKELEQHLHEYERNLDQLNHDIANLQHGKSVMSYLKDIEVQLTDVPVMHLLSVRQMVQKNDFPSEYENCFGRLFRRIARDNLTVTAPPMVLFHSAEFSPSGMDTEFAIPVRDYVTGTRDFCPGLCLRTVVRGSYSNLTSVYARQCGWAEQEGYVNTDALYEVYVTDPSQVTDENDLITEVYYPVKKKASKENINESGKIARTGNNNSKRL